MAVWEAICKTRPCSNSFMRSSLLWKVIAPLSFFFLLISFRYFELFNTSIPAVALIISSIPFLWFEHAVRSACLVFQEMN